MTEFELGQEQAERLDHIVFGGWGIMWMPMYEGDLVENEPLFFEQYGDELRRLVKEVREVRTILYGQNEVHLTFPSAGDASE